ncbi:hypothetical protein ES288_A05G418100v1 [Gossypium darwinii]|uniref:Uncharacterized protein n=1 Tax=Gossypium darwinii TaxID=34276 RepID=A0A5D2GQE0_GOSDA|nr:hypothetical protein ES288_A05G418100v1 [Gossypium darwinii]
MSKIKDLDRVENAVLLLLAFKTFRFGQQENVQGPDAQIDPLRAKHVGPATLKAIEWFCRTHFISYSHCFSNKKKQNASSSLLPFHFSLLGIQPSLRHPGGSSVPRTSTPPPVHGSGPAAKILESRGVVEWDAGERRAARGLMQQL